MNFIFSCLLIEACIKMMLTVTSARERCYECESEFTRIRTDDSDTAMVRLIILCHSLKASMAGIELLTQEDIKWTLFAVV